MGSKPSKVKNDKIVLANDVKDDNSHVMLSYNWDAQKRMLKLRDELKQAGYKVWMDIDNMEGNIDDRMAEAVENASAILMCFSEKYQNSISCKKEAQYANSLERLIIPLKFEDYKPTGWLGLMINSMLYYDVETDRDLMKSLPQIIKRLEVAIKDQGGKVPNGSKAALTKPKAQPKIENPPETVTKPIPKPVEQAKPVINTDVSKPHENDELDPESFPLGMKEGIIQDSQLTSSSEWNPNHSAINARLDRPHGNGKAGAWCAKTNDVNQWIQVDFGDEMKLVSGIVMQGRTDYEQWVKKYKVQYSNDGISWQFVKDHNQRSDKIFNGNTDRNSHSTCSFPASVKATYIRIRPVEWNGHVSLRFELYGRDVPCLDPLGMRDGIIQDSQLTTSSEWNPNHSAINARLDRPHGNGKAGAWCAKTNDVNQWIQVDFGDEIKLVSGIVMQGRTDFEQWVKKYKVQYSVDGISWQFVKDRNQDMVCVGNTDRNTPSISTFPSPVQAKLIKIRPVEWNGHVSLRFELLGRDVPCLDPLGMKDGRIEDSQLTSSSDWAPNHSAINARLDRPHGDGRTGAWSAKTNDVNQWIQVDFGDEMKSVSGIVIQGRTDYEQWVKKYKVQYSNDGITWQFVKDNNQSIDKVFFGNSDRNTPSLTPFPAAVKTTYIRLRPVEWNGHISLRFELLGRDVPCVDPLGMKDGTIQDNQITSSSDYNHVHSAINARLDRPSGNGRTGAWSALTNDVNQWIQVDFGEMKSVSGIVMQGRSDAEQWVTKYKVEYSNDGLAWQFVKDSNQINDKVFSGSSDRNSHSLSSFASAVKAIYIRIRPLEWFGHLSLRFEVLGRDVPCVDPLGMKDGTIQDSQITSSSDYNDAHSAINARLDRQHGNGRTGAWSAKTNDVNQWIKVDLGEMKSVSGIVMQGRSDYEQWVKKYKVEYSHDGITWEFVKDNQNNDKLFHGSNDRNTSVVNPFPAAVKATYIRIRPVEWNGHISLRFELLGRDVPCLDPLGIKDGRIEDSQLTTSSEWAPNHSAINARLELLHGDGRTGAWSAKTNDVNQWIKVDFGEMKSVSGIVMQGRSDCDQWVKKYKVQYSTNGIMWQCVKDSNQRNDKVFTGSYDRNTLVTSSFPSAVKATSIRIHPTEWHGHVSLRFEVLGRDV